VAGLRAGILGPGCGAGPGAGGDGNQGACGAAQRVRCASDRKLGAIGACTVLSSRCSGPVAGLRAGILGPGRGAGPGASGDDIRVLAARQRVQIAHDTENRVQLGLAEGPLRSAAGHLVAGCVAGSWDAGL
jgi:hypothetical protein